MTTSTSSNKRIPCMFVNHGGGPMPLLGRDNITSSNLKNIAELCRPREYSTNFKPRAILVISAHWESSPVKVTSSPHPSMLYDYHGFPEESYKFKYPAPGDPDLAKRVQALLRTNEIKCELDNHRGYDHGVFVPLMCAFPDADIPVVVLSLAATLDPEKHLAMGQALEPLRDEGVLIVGSGMSFHNMRQLMGGNSGTVSGQAFDVALSAAVTTSDVKSRHHALKNWEKLPGARNSHPREEHLLPLLVVAGAAGGDIGRRVDNGVFMGTAAVSAFCFP